MFNGRDYIDGYNDGYNKRVDYEHEMSINMIRHTIKRALVVAHYSKSYKEFDYSITRAYGFVSAYSCINVISYNEYHYYTNIIYKIDCKYRHTF